jgi:uncharacterized membrane protein YccF (DUF307 family)
MSTLGNILWILLGGGIIICLEYLIGGLLLCLTIIGIPFGIQCFKLAYLSLLPFGKRLIDRDSYTGCLAIAMNVLWILFGGLWIFLTHVIFAILCAITIIGIPFAKQHMKLAILGLTPFGKDIVSD